MKKYMPLFAFPVLAFLHLSLVGISGTMILNANAHYSNPILNLPITLLNCSFYFIWIWRFSSITSRKSAWLAIGGGSFFLLLCIIILLFYTSHFSINLKILSFTYYYEIIFYHWPAILLGSGIAYYFTRHCLNKRIWYRCFWGSFILLCIIALLYSIMIYIVQFSLFQNLLLYTIIAIPIAFFFLLSFWISISFYFGNEKNMYKQYLAILAVEIVLCLFNSLFDTISFPFLSLLFTIVRFALLFIPTHKTSQNQAEIDTWI